jgi:acyl-CoA synthetase (AMP-forming)/AMP-acid ligase II/thioesterase domain-containing protein/aryl carrier-like protein
LEEGSAQLSIPAVLGHWARATPDAPALLAPGRRPLTYAELYEQTRAVAARLRSVGIRPEDRVAIVHANGPELAAAFLAVSSVAVSAPLNPAYRMSELDLYLSDLGAKAMLVGRADDQLRVLADRRVIRLVEIEHDASAGAGAFTLSAGRAGRRSQLTPGRTALVLHTSGTTSRPKLVPLAHRALCLSARNIAETLELQNEDSCLNVMPLFHVHGLVGALLSSISAGASVICTPGFHAPSFHTWLSELEPTWYTAVPTMHQAVLARALSADGSGPTMRFIRSSSAPLPVHVHDELERVFGVPVIEAYGMTEAAHQLASNPLPPAARKRGAVGTGTGVEIGVLDPDLRPLPPGGIGEVVVRGETVFAGYESNPEANRESFVDGWFRTGDEGWIDEDGYLFLRGRTKEIINRGGEKISPAEVEEALLGHPDVEQAACFAVPHERLGEEVGAAVVVRAGAKVTERDLQQSVAERLADFKLPTVIRFVDEVPKGPTGKVERLTLADRLGIGANRVDAPVDYAPPSSAFQQEMASLWAETLDIPRVGVDDDFFALGGDSILAAELSARIAERHGTAPPLTMLMWTPTLGAFCSALENGSWKDDALIVPVQVEGSRPPLFVVHGLADEVLNVAALKRSLGDQQPLYALRARADTIEYDTVEDLAADYLREIRAVQPAGPYRFASMCSGGAIVMELTRCAVDRGEEVELAAVIDPRTDFGPRRVLSRYLRRGAEHARSGRLGWAVHLTLRAWVRRLTPARFRAELAPGEALARATSKLRRRYRLRRLPAPLTVISTMDYDVPREHWSKLAEDVRWYEVPAPHVTLFQQPHADVLGEVLARALREAT